VSVDASRGPAAPVGLRPRSRSRISPRRSRPARAARPTRPGTGENAVGISAAACTGPRSGRGSSCRRRRRPPSRTGGAASARSPRAATRCPGCRRRGPGRSARTVCAPRSSPPPAVGAFQAHRRADVRARRRDPEHAVARGYAGLRWRAEPTGGHRRQQLGRPADRHPLTPPPVFLATRRLRTHLSGRPLIRWGADEEQKLAAQWSRERLLWRDESRRAHRANRALLDVLD
jgi:hypothetical protein